MNTIKSLWKVVLTSQTGSQAPTYFVETTYVVINAKSKRENVEKETAKALELAKLKTRLSDFPNWTIEVIKQDRIYCQKRGKWLFR